MNIFWAIIMGLTQGLTEFFPISSSAHLTLMPWIFNFPDPGLTFDIALHAGTLVAIIIALWTDWIALAKGLLEKNKESWKLFGFLLLTSIPGAIFGVLLESKAESVFRTPLLIAFNLVFFGLVLWAIDKYMDNKKTISKMNWKDSIGIGLAQAFAIIPGVSRSGATITMGRTLKFKREDAVKYSFMAALPIIAGASLFGLRHATASEILSAPWMFGFLAAIISSVWAMKFLLKYVKTNNFNVFVWWRFGLAALVLALAIIRR
jgi:undecaprenyl-diphosphatase